MTYTGRFAAMTSSAIHHTTLLRHCFEWPRHCSNIPTLYWAKIVVANRLVCNMTLIEFSISNARGMVACLLGVPSFKAKRRKRGRRTKAFWARGWGGGGRGAGVKLLFSLSISCTPPACFADQRHGDDYIGSHRKALSLLVHNGMHGH